MTNAAKNTQNYRKRLPEKGLCRANPIVPTERRKELNKVAEYMRDNPGIELMEIARKMAEEWEK